MGVLPATSGERGPASALRWPWHNRKRASDLHGRHRVRPNGHSVSGDPQSEPDTQELPPTPASGAQASRGTDTGKGGGAPMRDLQGCAILGGIEGGQGHPSPAPVYYTG